MTSTKQMYVGKSLSMCVKDILLGRIGLDEVLRIESGTKIETVLELVRVSMRYYDTYWKTVEGATISRCLSIINHLIFHNKLHQQRVIESINNHLQRSIDLHAEVAIDSTDQFDYDDILDTRWWEVIEVELVSHPATESEEWKAKVGIRVVEEINE